MEYRKLDDLKVSVIGYGAWGIGGAPFWNNEGDNKSIESIKISYENGINFFDTAPVYGFGHSEKLIGKALKEVRDKVVIATKCGLRWGKESLSSLRKDASRKSILEEIDQSLRRLDTDRIDLYQVHWPDLETSHNETMETLLEIQNQGKIRYIGLSNYSAEQIKESLQYGKIISLQPEFSLLAREIEKDTVPLCLEKKIGIIAYSPLASGVLTGKYHKKTKFKDWRSKGIIGTFTGEGFVDNISKVDRLREIAREEGKTCGQTAINWVLRQPGLVTALVGVKNSSQMEENIKAIGWQPSKENCKKIEEIFALPVSGKISKV
ncbi:MAG: oxidoreductase [Nitrospina sp.]|nr:oxidoreductase [Nitrospina sp.]MDC0207210.1 aldo/keto reductase [Nitrospinota bacterium]|tara:strand:- start:2840 stop:3802 length:963 start_codon:yes stop_codon:yes gene_type:complete